MPQSDGRIELGEDMLFFQPVGTRVLISPIETPNEKSGIIIPEQAKEVYPIEGTILDMGEGVEDGRFKPGDRVAYSRYAGIELKFGDTRYLVLDENDILGIVLQGAPSLRKPH